MFLVFKGEGEGEGDGDGDGEGGTEKGERWAKLKERGEEAR
jgi:hypothetical protein